MIKILKKSLKLVGAYVLGFLIGAFGYWLRFNWSGFIGFIYDWQQLIGALLGAATPLGLFLINEWHQGEKKRKDYLFILEKNIVTAINNLSDIDRMLHGFHDFQLQRFKSRLEEDDRLGRPSVGQAFVPLSWTFTFKEELFKESTGSSYLENLVVQIVSTSQEMPILLQDISRQFDRTLNLNTQIGLMRVNDPKAHNQVLRANITEFENFLKLQTFGNNIPIYLRMLVQTRVALRTRIKLGLSKWKRTFNYPSPFSVETSQKMTAYFQPEVDIEIKELQKTFKSKLLLVNDRSPIPS